MGVLMSFRWALTLGGFLLASGRSASHAAGDRDGCYLAWASMLNSVFIGVLVGLCRHVLKRYNREACGAVE